MRLVPRHAAAAREAPGKSHPLLRAWQQNPQQLDVVIAIGCEAMFCTNEKANRANHAEGATLLQLIIQCCNQILNEKQWEMIFTKTLERLKNDDNMKTFLKARLYGVYLNGFIY